MGESLADLETKYKFQADVKATIPIKMGEYTTKSERKLSISNQGEIANKNSKTHEENNL